MKIVAFFETERSLLCSQVPANGSYAKSHEARCTGVSRLHGHFSIRLARLRPNTPKTEFSRTLEH